MSNQKRQKSVYSSPLKAIKSWPSKFWSWLRGSIPSGLRFMGYAMFGIAVVLLIIGLVALVSGQSGAISRFVDRNLGGYGSVLSGPSLVKQPNWTWIIIQNFYGYLLPLIYVVIILLPTVGIICLLSVLSSLGRLAMRLPYSLAGNDSLSVRLLSTLIAWTSAIVVVWLVVNADPVIYILFIIIGLLLANLAFFAGEYYWLQKWPGATKEPADIEASNQ